MLFKQLGVALLVSLTRRADAADQCGDFCPSGVMTIVLQPKKVIAETPVRVTGYISTDGPISFDPEITASLQGAPGVVDTVITFTGTETQVLTT